MSNRTVESCLYSTDFILVSNGGHGGEEDDKSYQPKTSCLSCRNLHRRCSRTLPKCSACITHRRKCIYSSKKQRQPSINMKRRTNSIIEPQIAISEGLMKKSIKRQTLNVYMDLVCMGIPFISPQQFENLLFSENLDGDQHIHHTQTVSLKAFFLSIQSICDQRFGRRDAAITSFNEAKSELHLVFEDYDNYFNICTYNNLAYFAASEGDDQMSQWFMAPVEYFFSKYNQSNFNQNNECNGLAFENLDKGRGITKLFYFDNRYKWTNLTYGSFISIPFKIVTGKDLPPQLRQILDQDLNENTAKSEIAVLDCIVQFMRQYHQTLTHSPSFVKLSRIVDVSNFSKTRIESIRVLFSKSTTQEQREFYFMEMLKFANAITNITMDDLFPYIMPSNIFAFALAAEIHLESFFHFSHLVSMNEIINFLKQDFKALTTLSRKYGRVQKNYGNIYETVQSVLLEYGIPPGELLILISNNTDSPLSFLSPNSVNNQSLTTISPTTNRSTEQPISENTSPNKKKKRDFPSIAFLNNTLRNFKEKISNHQITTTPQPQQVLDSPTISKSTPTSEEEISYLKNQAQSILKQNFSNNSK